MEAGRPVVQTKGDCDLHLVGDSADGEKWMDSEGVLAQDLLMVWIWGFKEREDSRVTTRFCSVEWKQRHLPRWRRLEEGQVWG